MTEFVVHGPFPIPTYKQASGGRALYTGAFWENLDGLQSRHGVYVFAIKPPRTKTYTPYYVGQATNTFKHEVFHASKLNKYQRALNDYKRGAPAIFLLVHPRTKTNRKEITELEDFLIMMGFAANQDIQNDQGAKLPGWSIKGVVRSTAKKASAEAKLIAGMFKIKSRLGV